MREVHVDELGLYGPYRSGRARYLERMSLRRCAPRLPRGSCWRVLECLLVLDELADALGRVEGHVGKSVWNSAEGAFLQLWWSLSRSQLRAVVLVHAQDESAVGVAEDARDVGVDLFVGHAPELALSAGLAALGLLTVGLTAARAV